jgi:hypothetical protein
MILYFFVLFVDMLNLFDYQKKHMKISIAEKQEI